jgi:saccharopine dehydrogenase (NADP+, L-glutamate forming)
VPGYGDFEGYANRDSLKYLEDYKLNGIKTMLRGTLRNDGFCSAWYAFVYLGCCDDSYKMEGVSNMSHRDFFGAFVNYDPDRTLEERIARRCSLTIDGAEMQKLKWMGMFEYEPVGLVGGTPAQILVHILNKKWKLASQDKDMIVMWHRFKFVQNNEQKEIQASLVVEGEDSVHTAMAKTVGLPMAIASKLILQNQIKKRGVAIPVDAEIYEPVLAELKTLGVELVEREI